MPTTPADFIENVVKGEDGFWRSSSESAVSYPEDGHDCCHAIEQKSFWFSHRNRSLKAVITNLPPPADRPFLDVGGGNGFVARK